MISVPDPNPYAPNSALDQTDKDAHQRGVARRRWMVQREQERKRLRRQRAAMVIERFKLNRSQRTGQGIASSLSPVYNVFNDRYLRRR